ncbi:MraY family glycosyltransferase [Candidatus Jidaibacter acanthamoebae]|nr:glycosyltransferase family 4 protein [Candidatus Jidaibacter acanthamoeba]
MSLELSIVTLIGCFIFSYLLSGNFIRLLTKKKIIAIPNSRSNHKSPTPLGGGLAIIISFFIGCIPFLFLYNDTVKPPLYIASALALLCVISFRDDIKHVPAAIRLIAHFVAAIIGAFVVKHNGLIFKGIIDPDIEYIFIVLAIVTFINLFNFMDGIDGITGAQVIYLGIAIALILSFLNNQSSYIYISLLLVACTFGFLIYNWHPARIFIGDAGSITIGYILSLLLLIIAAKGAWVQAIILPMYYFADAGYILLKRAISLEKIWQAHSEHFFQRAVRAGRSHAEVVVKIIILNIILLNLSLGALHFKGEILIECLFILCALVGTIVTINILPIKIPLLDLKAKR